MSRRLPFLLALALVGCDSGIPDDTDDTGTDEVVDPDTADIDSEIDPDTDTELDTDTEVDTDRIGDVNEVNDTPEQATAIPLLHQQFGLDIHSSDDVDFFRIDVAERIGARFRIEFTHADGDLDLRLETAEGGTVAVSQSVENIETLQPVLAEGTYYLEVYGFQGATGPYDITVETFEVEDVDVDDVFSDLVVRDLRTPQVFGQGLDQTFALASDIYNIGTAPAPGSTLGDGTGEFRLRQLDGTIVATGIKGPIFFTNNGGCPGVNIYDEWIERGEPHIPGSEGNNSLTDPGCVDYYGAATNNALDTPIVIGDPAVVPDGDYLYELEVDAAGTYVWEAAFARGNNSSWRPIRISTRATGDRLVRPIGPLVVGGQVIIDAGPIATVLGSGDPLVTALGPSPDTSSDIGRVWGVARDPAGLLLATLPDAGALVRVLADGDVEALIIGMPGIRGVDVAADGTLIVADAVGNALWTLSYTDGSYGVATPLPATGVTWDEPSSARFGADGTVWVANTGANTVVAVVDGQATVAMGTGEAGRDGDGGPATDAKLYRPLDLDIGDDGMLVIADSHSNRIRLLNTHATDTLTLGGIALEPGAVHTLAGVGDIAASDADPMDNGLAGYNGNLRHGRASMLDWPTSVQIVGDRVFFIDSDNHRLRVVDEHGTMHRIAGIATVPSPEARAPGTAETDVADGNSASGADLNHPIALWVHPTDTGYRIDVADSGNHRVRTLADVVLTPGPSLDD